MDRRTFIFNSTGSLAIISSPVLTPLTAAAFTVNQADSAANMTDNSEFTHKQWRTIAAVQNHLFPSEPDTPGALEINSITYLHDYLTNPMTDPLDRAFLHQGVMDLEKRSQTETGQPFIDLSNAQREKILRLYEQQRQGRRWLTTILNYLLEALLTDPVYGGNPQGVGWKWLEHRAGQPRPPVNKRYWLL